MSSETNKQKNGCNYLLICFPLLTVSDSVIDGDDSFARFSKDCVHGHTQHQLKRLWSL